MIAIVRLLIVRRRMQAPFLLEPSRELGVGQGIEQSDHANRDRGVFDQFDHGVGDRPFFTVETDDKSRGDEYAGGIYFMNALDQAALGLSLIHISEPTRLGMISYAVFCL